MSEEDPVGLVDEIQIEDEEIKLSEDENDIDEDDEAVVAASEIDNPEPYSEGIQPQPPVMYNEPEPDNSYDEPPGYQHGDFDPPPTYSDNEFVQPNREMPVSQGASQDEGRFSQGYGEDDLGGSSGRGGLKLPIPLITFGVGTALFILFDVILAPLLLIISGGSLFLISFILTLIPIIPHAVGSAHYCLSKKGAVKKWASVSIVCLIISAFAPFMVIWSTVSMFIIYCLFVMFLVMCATYCC